MKRLLVTGALLGLVAVVPEAEGRPGRGGRHCGHGHVGVTYCPILPAAAVEEVEDDTVAMKFRRFLRVANDTKERLTVFVQYETWHMDGSWHWHPNAPAGDEALVYTLEPGEEADLQDDDWALLARRVRIWAEGEKGAEFSDFKDEDLWLVEEVDGERSYDAPEVETFTFRFLAADE